MTIIPVLSGARAAAWIAGRAEPPEDLEAHAAVGPIVAAVRARGDAALREFTERFDGVSPASLRVSASERCAALLGLAPERRRALEEARANIETVHRPQRHTEAEVSPRGGVTVRREFRPIERVGIYVPGGGAAYPSTVLMCGVPARLAGCETIVLCTPPRADGRVPESVLAAAELVGIDHVYAVGGAQAIAAMAYGTETVPRVDKIVGPGNRWVTAAKQLVYGAVDIDMPAGPSEIVVLADDTAHPAWVAADLLSQAEHAPDALAVCVTTDVALATRAAQELERQVTTLPRADRARASLGRSAICIAPELGTAIAWVNLLAPEHVTIVTRDDDRVREAIRNAGSVFLGPFAPVSAGDYASGANHVLPTARRARAFGALSVDDFGRWIQVQWVTRDGLRSLADAVTTLARWEGFEAHARAVEIRLEEPV